ncbi:MAG: hypothetical protein GY927_06710 [bacterium]|nr:hypothetical protein [bacterium]
MNSIEAPVSDEIDDNAPIPGTVFNKRQARMLKYLVIVMGLMLIFGFALMIGIIAYRASQPATEPKPIAPAAVTVPTNTIKATMSVQNLAAAPPIATRTIKSLIPKGATYLDSTVNGNRLVLTLQTKNKGLNLLLIDLDRWRIIGNAILTQEH